MFPVTFSCRLQEPGIANVMHIPCHHFVEEATAEPCVRLWHGNISRSFARGVRFPIIEYLSVSQSLHGAPDKGPDGLPLARLLLAKPRAAHPKRAPQAGSILSHDRRRRRLFEQ